MERPRLTYFDLRGRAEPIRLLLHATQSEFEDKRIVSGDEWSALKPTLPFGVMPIYEESGIRLAESHAILRHLGRRLTPAPTEAGIAELDVAQEYLAESQEQLWRFQWTANYYERLEAYALETLRLRLQRLQAWLMRERPGSREWFGASFSYVDCLAFHYLDEVDAFFPVVLAEFAELVAFHRRAASIPRVAAYLNSASRPIVFGISAMGPKVDARLVGSVELRFSFPGAGTVDLTEIVRNQRRLTAFSR